MDAVRENDWQAAEYFKRLANEGFSDMCVTVTYSSESSSTDRPCLKNGKTPKTAKEDMLLASEELSCRMVDIVKRGQTVANG